MARVIKTVLGFKFKSGENIYQQLLATQNFKYWILKCGEPDGENFWNYEIVFNSDEYPEKYFFESPIEYFPYVSRLSITELANFIYTYDMAFDNLSAVFHHEQRYGSNLVTLRCSFADQDESEYLSDTSSVESLEFPKRKIEFEVNILDCDRINGTDVKYHYDYIPDAGLFCKRINQEKNFIHTTQGRVCDFILTMLDGVHIREIVVTPAEDDKFKVEWFSRYKSISASHIESDESNVESVSEQDLHPSIDILIGENVSFIVRNRGSDYNIIYK
jgi:hypothetical protein